MFEWKQNGRRLNPDISHLFSYGSSPERMGPASICGGIQWGAIGPPWPGGGSREPFGRFPGAPLVTFPAMGKSRPRQGSRRCGGLGEDGQPSTTASVHFLPLIRLAFGQPPVSLRLGQARLWAATGSPFIPAPLLRSPQGKAVRCGGRQRRRKGSTIVRTADRYAPSVFAALRRIHLPRGGRLATAAGMENIKMS